MHIVALAPAAYEAARQPIRRKCIRTLRELVDAVPKLGSAVTFLKADRRAHDAVYTLNAMGYRPDIVAEFVQRETYSEAVHMDILSCAAILKVNQLLRSV